MNNNTTQRSIRIPDDLWHQVQSQAAQDHINVSALIRGLLRGWLDTDNEGGEMITTSGEHKITVEVELGDGTIVRRVVKFSGGNPLFHAKETVNAADKAASAVVDALAGMYGDIRARFEGEK